MTPRPHYNTQKLIEDLALRGWNYTAAARETGLSVKTVAAFIQGHIQTPKTCAKLAGALGYSTRRYLIRQEGRMTLFTPRKRMATAKEAR